MTLAEVIKLEGDNWRALMNMFSKISIMAVLVSLLAVSAVDVSAQTKRRPVIRRATAKVNRTPAPRLYAVSSGKSIRVRMNDTISSKTARVGQTFTTNVTESVYST